MYPNARLDQRMPIQITWFPSILLYLRQSLKEHQPANIVETQGGQDKNAGKLLHALLEVIDTKQWKRIKNFRHTNQASSHLS